MEGTILWPEMVTKKDIAPTFMDFTSKVETDVRQTFTPIMI